MGNSSGVIIPKPMLSELGAHAGDEVEMSLEAGKIIISPVERPPRLGWREASRALAEAGEDGLVWPEFGNLDDENLKW
jgi:antitoxin MazE